MKLEKMILQIRESIFTQKRIEKLLSKVQFQYIFEKAEHMEKEKLESLIKISNFEEIRLWFHKHKAKQLRLLSLRELRVVAARIGILSYCHFPKEILLALIMIRSSDEDSIDPNDSPGNEVFNTQIRST